MFWDEKRLYDQSLSQKKKKIPDYQHMLAHYLNYWCLLQSGGFVAHSQEASRQTTYLKAQISVGSSLQIQSP
jgi:hypothetical protein